MSTNNRRLFLNLIVNSTGRHPSGAEEVGQPDAFRDIAHYAKVGALAHEGTFDTLWLINIEQLGPSTRNNQSHMITLDPVVLLAALARDVPDIGLVPTMSTSLNQPYALARSIQTLDNVSDGRAGVNLVASYQPGAAMNFGRDKFPEHDDRYGQADQFIEVFHKLSDSWGYETAAEIGERGFFYDPKKVRPIDFQGNLYNVRGPLQVPQTRQGRPVISVAGGSEQTKWLASRRADVLYTALTSKDEAIAFTKDVKDRAEAFGRPRNAIKVMPGFVPIIGSTQEEAERRLDDLTLRAGGSTDPVEIVADLMLLDPKTLHPDRQLTEEQLTLPADWKRPTGFWYSIVSGVRRENMTVRQLAKRFQMSHGHNVVVGTPDVIADFITDWWSAGAVDGFTVYPEVSLTDIRRFVDEVTPVLRKRGIFPEGYDKGTLRSRLEASA